MMRQIKQQENVLLNMLHFYKIISTRTFTTLTKTHQRSNSFTSTQKLKYYLMFTQNISRGVQHHKNGKNVANFNFQEYAMGQSAQICPAVPSVTF